MLRTRWKKVIADLWSNKTRTLLVVLSIFIGVFAVGMITSSQAVLSSDLQASYLRVNPAHATISMTDQESFNDDLVDSVRNMQRVADAEGRRNLTVQVQTGANEWRSLQLTTIPNFNDININQISPERGAWPPPDKTILIERSGVGYGMRKLNATTGESILIEQPDGTRETVRVSGVVHDINQFPTLFTGTIYGYITLDTAEWLTGARDYNQMVIRVAGQNDNQEHNRTVAEQVWEKIQKTGREPAFPTVPQPGQHPADDLINGITTIMGALGVLSVFLSGFLVTNTISALLTIQVRQIGIMKTVGARASQIMGMYMVLVLCFGLLALVMAIPLSNVATDVFTRYIAGIINFDLTNVQMTGESIALQAMVSLVIPLLASLAPIISGTRVTILEALNSEGAGSNYGQGVLDRIVQSIRGLPRPFLISLRNTFRRKSRLVLTLLTLTLGGAIFIAILSIRESLLLTVDDILDTLFNYDVQVSLDRGYRSDYLVSEAQRVPGVVEAESWTITNVRRIYPDDSESLNITLFAVPPDTQMINPKINAGRWLLSEDENALVISTGMLNDDPDIAVGDRITLNLKGREEPWRVVGVMQAIGQARWAYASYDYYSRVARELGEASNVQLTTKQHSLEYQSAVATAVEEHFQSLGIEVSSTEKTMQSRAEFRSQFRFIVVSLLIMSVLIAIVGGLGLAGTMSLNVLERTREIGIMRAVGASDSTVLQVVITEGVIIGLLSWGFASLLAIPISQTLSTVAGRILFQVPLTFSFSTMGVILWLIIALTLAILASFFPAWNASKLTVRDVLAYE